MIRKLLVLALSAVIATSYFEPVETQSPPSTPVVLHEGARLIPGDGSAPVADSAFLVENGTIAKVGKKGDVTQNCLSDSRRTDWLKEGDPLMKLLQESVSEPVIARMK